MHHHTSDLADALSSLLAIFERDFEGEPTDDFERVHAKDEARKTLDAYLADAASRQPGDQLFLVVTHHPDDLEVCPHRWVYALDGEAAEKLAIEKLSAEHPDHTPGDDWYPVLTFPWPGEFADPRQPTDSSHTQAQVEIARWFPADPVDPEDNHLVATIAIAGLDMHLDAYRMAPPVDGSLQHPHSTDHDNTIGHLAAAFGPDKPWATATIGGHPYIIFASPYCR